MYQDNVNAVVDNEIYFIEAWMRGNKMFICLFVNKMYKQIIPPVSLSLLLCAFPLTISVRFKIMAKHGLHLFSAKARLSSFAVLLNTGAKAETALQNLWFD